MGYCGGGLDAVEQILSRFYSGAAFPLAADAASAVTFRPMMGEYILYYKGKIFGGIYDDRLLVKPVKSAAAMMPDAARELPYEGAKPMLLADNVDDADFLTALVRAMYEELPEPKPKKKTEKGKGKK